MHYSISLLSLVLLTGFLLLSLAHKEQGEKGEEGVEGGCLGKR